MEKKTLTLVLKKEFFEQILSGVKQNEYREVKPYWQNRLDGKKYDQVLFIMGYNKDAPRMTVEFLGLKKETKFFTITNTLTMCYSICLGKILSTQNCETFKNKEIKILNMKGVLSTCRN